MSKVKPPSVNELEQLFTLKLSKNFDESSDHPEYKIRLANLDNKYTVVLRLFNNVDKNSKSLVEYVAFVTLLYHELRSTGPWNTSNCLDYADQIDTHFILHFGTSIPEIFEKKTVLNMQEIFDDCLQKLHKKSSEFKKYPSLVEVYCVLIQNIKSYNVLVNPSTVLPISLILIDDYIPDNKIKGLNCCKTILEYLLPKDFEDGNFYEVIYLCLKKLFVEKDVEITKSLLDSLKEFLRILPESVKCWRDQKRKARLEGGALNRALNATGNNIPVPNVSGISQIILETIGEEMAVGIGPEESPIGFVRSVSPRALVTPPPLRTTLDPIRPGSSHIPQPTIIQPQRRQRQRARRAYPHDQFLAAQLELNGLMKVTKTDEVYSEILDQLCSESNLYRKAAMLDFTQYVMELHKVNCVRRKKLFNAVICDNLDLCCNEGVEELLLCSVLESLQTWTKYCWCVWELSTDQKILSTLFKCIYLSKNEENIKKIINLLLTLINLCTKEEKADIIKNLDDCKLSTNFLEKILGKYI